jgi:LysR family transcriptional regulator (chromosome initiation inhibitor)
MRRHFADGVDAAALSRAPVLRFDRRDMLQAHWARDAAGVAHLAAPTHWVPATQGFLDTVLAGLGWGMQPLALIAAHLADGRLMELKPGFRFTLALHWQYARLEARLLTDLTEAVRRAAALALVAP